MRSKFKNFFCYDLETGGFSSEINPITEFAGVIVDNQNLEIQDQLTFLIKPYLDLSHIEHDAKKEAKTIFNNLSKTDQDTKIKSVEYMGNKLTLKTIDPLIEDIEDFLEFLDDRIEDKKGLFFTYDEYLEMLNGEYSNVFEIYFRQAYNPSALETTHIDIDMLLNEGIEISEAATRIKEFLAKHTVGNSKPIATGHNIIDFDNPFMKNLFAKNGFDFEKCINSFMLDTYDLAQIRWFDAPAFNLGSCANELGLTLKEAHRALADATANAKVLIKMLKSLRGEGDQKSTYQRRRYKLNF